YVWNGATEGEGLADELKGRTEDGAWEVVEVNGPPSEGPLGPVEIQGVRQSDGWTFALHPLSRQMVQKLFPGSCRRNSISIRMDTHSNGQAVRDDVADMAEQVVVLLTGLGLEQLTATFGGYRVYDPVSRKELVASAPVHA